MVGASSKRGSQMLQNHCTSQTELLDEVGHHWKAEAWNPTGWASSSGPHMCLAWWVHILPPIYSHSNLSAHLSWLQDQHCPRQIHLTRQLRYLAAVLDRKTVSINAQPFNNQARSWQPSSFVQEGYKLKASPSPPNLGSLNAGLGKCEWTLNSFPSEIALTTLHDHPASRPHPMVEPTVFWEDAFDKAHEHKKLCYTNFADEAEDKG